MVDEWGCSVFEETTRWFGRVKEVGEDNGNCGTNGISRRLRKRAGKRDARPNTKGDRRNNLA